MSTGVVRQAGRVTPDVRLGGYPAKKCPRVTHNDNSPFSPEKDEPDANLQQLFDEGIGFEQRVTDALLVTRPDAVFIEPGWESSIQATMAAIERGESLIINGRLPSVEGRTGAPDLLVRVGDGYLPVDIKHHGTFGKQKKAVLVYSSLTAPETRRVDPDRSGDGGHRGDDTLQLAHYTRMLQRLGVHAGGELWGGIIGTSSFADLTGQGLGITWYDLDLEHEQTYSASAPNHRKKRSPLERYDHEFAFRMEVARAARAGRELVRPIGTAECWRCPWQEYCASIVGPDDASFAFTSSRLDAREWLFLAAHGASTIEGLAALDIASVEGEFARHAVNKQKPGERLRAAVERARMIRDDIDLEPLGDFPEVPAADVEIDLDIEWGTDQRIYQWGVRVRDGQDEGSASYLPHLISYDVLDEVSEAALADECADRLEAVIAGAGSRSVAIYHWSHVEVSRSRRFPRIAALLDAHGVDLHSFLRQHFRVRDSYSIKDVAPLFGFEWGVDDAGGYASMRMIDAARMGSEEARQWCLEYNESDVAAQAAIRDGLRARRG